MIHVLLSGCNGNMGKEIADAINNSSNFIITSGFDRIINKTLGFPVHNNTSYIKEQIDVIIDFSSPNASINMLQFATKNKIPMVIATTGFFNPQLRQIETASKQIPIFKSSNMSLQLNIMKKIVSKLSQTLTDCDIEIIETHHRNKKDAPSGTALFLADSINSVSNNKYIYNYNRANQNNIRKINEIGIHSIRGGTEVGKHSVLFLGDNESLEITHSVNSKSIFAKGALKAAEFIVNQTPGLYNMDNLS